MSKKDKKKFSKELERIRRRASYKCFQEMLKFLNRNPHKIDILRKMHQVIQVQRFPFSKKQHLCIGEYRTAGKR